MKKTKTQRTELDRIVTQLRTVLRRATKDVIVIGELLIKSRKHLEHGEWQDWLAENFDLSYVTAINYCDAAEYVARKGKSTTIVDFSSLAPTVLYRLAAGRFNAEEEAAILAATSKGRVDQARASAICDELAPPDTEEPDEVDNADDDDEVEAPEDAETKAILDGLPPDVSPAPNPPPTNFALRDFNEAIGTLKRLMTKPSAQFASTIHNANDLESVESFIHAVTKTKGEQR